MYALWLVCGLSIAQAQQTPIRGRVTDENGAPLPGATITIKNTRISVTADAQGAFSIDPGNHAQPILVITSVGYGSIEVAATPGGTVPVVLQSVTKSLNDVVVVGYGSQRKRDVTGAISSVKSEDIAKRPITQAQGALQGTTPGVVVTQTSGQPGGNPFSVRIRGYNSITGGNDPLYVIDGFIGGNIESLSPEDIDDIEILKDASATAIYGSRASNGVVLITTKKGRPGKARVTFSTWFQNNQVPKELKLMNAYQFAKTVNLQDSMNGSGASFNQTYLDSLQLHPAGTDWQRSLQRKPWVQNYQVGVSGATDQVNYLFSLSYLDQPGLILNQWYKRTTFRSNVGVKVNKKLDLQFNVYGEIPQSHNNSYPGDLLDPFAQAFQWDPISPIKDAGGNWIPSAPYASIQYNPIAQATNQAVDGNSVSVAATGILTWHILKSLTFTSNNTYSLGYNYNQSVFGPNTGNGFIGTDYAQVYSARGRSYQNSNFLTWHQVFGGHSLTVTALYEQANGLSMSTTSKSTNLSTYALGYYNLGLGATQTTSSTYSADALQSYMGRINYAFKDRYMLDATLRDDGSSHLVKKYSLFPSFGAAWNISREAFMQGSVFSDLKIRGGYGVTGNQAVPAYATIPQINVGGIENASAYFYDGTTPTRYTPLGGPVSTNLQWEDDAQADAGLDAGFLHGRLNFTADAYHKKITHLLYQLQAPYYNSGQTYAVNLGSMMNEGLEFGLGGTPVKTRDFSWNGFFTISFNRNKLLNLGGLDNVAVNGIGSPETGLSLLKVGNPMGEFYGYKFLGTWKTTEAQQAAAYGNKPGDSHYQDVNNDGKIDANDLVPIGNGLPKYSFGFSNTLTYKDFDLYFMLQGTHGNQIYSETIAYTWGGVGDQRNPTTVDALNMWTSTNQTNNPTFSKTSSNYINSSRWVYDGSYIKLRNISLTYHIPQSVTGRWKMSSLEVYVSGQNLFCITKFPGYDPEVQNVTGPSTGTAFTAGLENGIIPVPKSYTFGLRAAF
ncbi:TonB-linked SusC/RagA family outer membrane protein [Dinghuibacter silviterrae]|uniref:TonB-linked SusC/RagA family outer membrane protein n=2 Tax=Dinghuibacter silviterrae TaxID=1539049 RepID=A0A4R8DHK1_9BACT|nr:TonB-linked SusC/RagA family outer membrane protein [Dinghuibacter silviterrae]